MAKAYQCDKCGKLVKEASTEYRSETKGSYDTPVVAASTEYRSETKGSYDTPVVAASAQFRIQKGVYSSKSCN